MFNKIMFLLSNFAVMTISAMYYTPIDLKPWVQAAKKITVVTKDETNTLNINDSSTVLDIKNKLRNIIGTTIDEQKLLPLTTSWSTLCLFYIAGEPVDNDDIIKDIMNEYDTDHFFVELNPQK